jgi:hypothetical protein
MNCTASGAKPFTPPVANADGFTTFQEREVQEREGP